VTDLINSRIRGIVDRPIVELVEVGMESRRDATRLLSFQYVLRLGDDVEWLLTLRKEIDDAIRVAQAEAGGVH
jgi:hypothetical protein